MSLYETARGSYQELPSQYQHETTVLIEEESLLHDMKAVTHHRGRMAQLWIAFVPFLVAIGLLVLSFAPATTSEISQRIPRPHLSWSRGGIHARDSGTSCVPGTPPPVVPPPVTNSSFKTVLVPTSSRQCFNFFMQPDPTNGQVNYIGQSDAVAAGLVSSTPQSSIMRADYRTDLLAGMRRNSIRIESKAAVPLGSLIVADIIRMPYGCGTWPAFWTYGTQSTWPAGGEIDILEGVNLQTHNQYTLHTSSSACKIDPNAVTKSSLMPNNNDCSAYNNYNAGCSYLDSSSTSYGQGLNANGGGVWATLFAPSGISIWFWPRSQVPANILTPDYTKWGPPSATWPSTSCSMSFFSVQTFVFDLTLCGDWAGQSNVWGASSCSAQTPTCNQFVQTGANWINALWEVKYVKTYSVN